MNPVVRERELQAVRTCSFCSPVKILSLVVSLYNAGNAMIEACLECDGNIVIEISCNVAGR